MKIYLYCSYTHSKRGFVLSQLAGNELAAVNLSGSGDTGERLVNQFFSYDAFRILWQDYPGEKSFPVFPRVEGSLFGIRGLRGSLEDRTGVVNFALLADREETEELNAIASGILTNPEAFALEICRCLSIGGPCGYKADGEALQALLKNFRGKLKPEGETNFGRLVCSVRDLLKFAVYIGSWEQAAEYLYPRWIWKLCPKQAISQEEYAQLLGRDIWK